MGSAKPAWLSELYTLPPGPSKPGCVGMAAPRACLPASREVRSEGGAAAQLVRLTWPLNTMRPFGWIFATLPTVYICLAAWRGDREGSSQSWGNPN